MSLGGKGRELARFRGVFGDRFFDQEMLSFFQERFRNAGGRYFDPQAMKATVNGDIGLKVLTGMMNDQKFMPPGSQDWGIPESLNGWLSGKLAMTLWWPPVGRW